MLRKELSDGLRVIESDEDTILMVLVVDKVKNLVLYFDHDGHVGRLSHEDVLINPVANLPKVVFSPRMVQHVERVDERLPEFYRNLERQEPHDDTAGATEDSEEDSDFVDTNNEVDDVHFMITTTMTHRPHTHS